MFYRETNQMSPQTCAVYKQRWCLLFALFVWVVVSGMYTDQSMSLTHFGLEEGGWVLFSLTSDLLHPPTLLCATSHSLSPKGWDQWRSPFLSQKIGALSSSCHFSTCAFSDCLEMISERCCELFRVHVSFLICSEFPNGEIRRRMLRLVCLLFIVWGRRSYVCVWSPTLFGFVLVSS